MGGFGSIFRVIYWFKGTCKFILVYLYGCQFSNDKQIKIMILKLQLVLINIALSVVEKIIFILEIELLGIGYLLSVGEGLVEILEKSDIFLDPPLQVNIFHRSSVKSPKLFVHPAPPPFDCFSVI